MSSILLGPEWNLSPEGLNSITQNGAIKDTKTVMKNALDSDLKKIGKPSLANELSKSQFGKLVLQIQKIRNISAPKAKEESQAAPRMLKLTLTDGDTYIQAIEISQINSISRDKTAPGTKVLINGAKVVSGFLLINPQNFAVLGGQVEHLYDKWLLAKSIQQNHQFGKVSNEGAPTWVAFGTKILAEVQDKPFKSLEKSKDSNNDSEFDQQRKDAIAEVTSGAVRKTFGGRVKHNVQPVQNNHLYNKGGRNGERDQDRGRKGKFAQKNEDDIEKLQRPSEKVSLFSFLEDKLPLSEDKKTHDQKSNTLTGPVKQNNQKDFRNQQKTESNYGDSESKYYLKHQPEKNSYNRHDKSKSQQNYTSNSMSSSSSHNLPQNSFNATSSTKSTSINEKTNNYSVQNNTVVGDNISTHNPGSNPQNRANTDLYSQQYRKDHFNHSAQRQNYQNSKNSQQSSTNHSSKSEQSCNQNTSQNVDMHHLANNLSKMSVSNEFASRSLRQHLNLGPPKKQEEHGGQGIASNSLNVGDQCMARYWEDGKFYPATVAAITDKTYAIQFTGYGNIEEVLKRDCFSPASLQHNRNPNYSYPQNQFSGSSMEFRSRRGPPRN